MFNIQYKEQIREFLSRKGLTEEIVCLKALGWMNRSQAPLILFSCPWWCCPLTWPRSTADNCWPRCCQSCPTLKERMIRVANMGSSLYLVKSAWAVMVPIPSRKLTPSSFADRGWMLKTQHCGLKSSWEWGLLNTTLVLDELREVYGKDRMGCQSQ